jgi:hypothetical protein
MDEKGSSGDLHAWIEIEDGKTKERFVYDVTNDPDCMDLIRIP